MEFALLLVLGVLICVIGIVNFMGNISTVHSYNRRNVKEEDVPKYGRAVGTGTFLMGLSLIAAFFLAVSAGEECIGWAVVPGFAAGLAFLLYGQMKYNGGIF